METADVIIIGGGFYGAVIAAHLAQQHQFNNIILFERENNLMKRASLNNQARVHNGYHYPRSYTTAYRSHVNFPKFVNEWSYAVKCDFIKLYAIANNNSKISASQFFRFCKEIGVPIKESPSSINRLFNDRLISRVYQVEEYAFDATQLANFLTSDLAKCSVRVLTNSQVSNVLNGMDGQILVDCTVNGKINQKFAAKVVINCTYSGLNQLTGDFQSLNNKLKHEITEMALVSPSSALEHFGVTVMDGAFFSMMPYPPRNLHTLSHVRFTPHTNWIDSPGLDPYTTLDSYSKHSRADRMIRDASRYIPAIAHSNYVDSLFEVKTVLYKNEIDDGRPILFEENKGIPYLYSVLGGKLDNIFDVLEKIDLLVPSWMRKCEK